MKLNGVSIFSLGYVRRSRRQQGRDGEGGRRVSEIEGKAEIVTTVRTSIFSLDRASRAADPSDGYPTEAVCGASAGNGRY